MKSKLIAMAACLLLGGLTSLAEAGVHNKRRCVQNSLGIACGVIFAPCHCIDGVYFLSPSVKATWCRDRGPTC